MITFTDLRLAARYLAKSPGFTVAAVLTLALGIGATTAIFSTVNAALLKPLPYPRAEDLYGLRTTLTDGRVTTGLLSPVELRRLNEAHLDSVDHAAGTSQQDVTLLLDDGRPMKITAHGVSEGFFELFGLPMTQGGFQPEHFAPNQPPVVVISKRMWRDIYNNDAAIVGKAIHFAEGGLDTHIVGVAPDGFDIPHDADLWFGQPLGPQDVGHNLEGYLRLKPGVPLSRATAEMQPVMNAVAEEFPASAKNRIYVVRPLVTQIVGELRTILLVVLGATGVLLLLAAVNVTNLQLARGAARAREMAVRVALGAMRARVVRQLLAESVVLAAAGAVTGLLLAMTGVRVMLAAGASRLPRLQAVTFDTDVLLFALGVMLVTGLIVGFAPALRLANTDLKTLMNESSRSASGGRATSRWLNTLMVAEIALSVVLVACAGWLVKSFANLTGTDPGFDAGNRIIFDVTMNQPQDPPAVDAAFEDLYGRLRAMPGVKSVAGSANFPLKLAPENSLLMQFKGEPFDRDNPMGSRQRFVSPGFFDAMGTKIVAGRGFDDNDRFGGQQVAVINQTFAERYLTGRNPIGIHILSGYPEINPQSEAEIVGVVEDIRQKSIGESPEPAYYTSDRQVPFFRQRTVVIETAANIDPMTLQPNIRDEIARTDPQMAVTVTRLSALVGDTLERQALGMRLMLIFGAAAVLLAAVGIYGVIAYAASQRRGEVATRLALGATPGRVFLLMLRQGRWLTLAGAAIGVTAAYLLGRVVASQLYEVRAADPWILGAAVLTVAAIATVATMIPALRSAQVDPSHVLRPE
jgi:predicted permease